MSSLPAGGSWRILQPSDFLQFWFCEEAAESMHLVDFISLLLKSESKLVSVACAKPEMLITFNAAISEGLACGFLFVCYCCGFFCFVVV